MKKPKLIFKYRAVSSPKEFDRLSDILKNQRLYLPTIPQLNDPFEGKLNVSFGIPGSFIIRSKDNDFSPVKEAKAKTRLLALSEDCFSPQLWAYYCNDYHGVCLCFKTDSTFDSIKPVNYPEHRQIGNPVIEPSWNQIYQLLSNSLLTKQEGWKYEHEWRMIFQPQLDSEDKIITESPSFLPFDSNELVGIIFGNKLSDSEKSDILAITPAHVNIFNVHTGALTGKVKLEEYGYKYPGDGSKYDYISSVEELNDRIMS